MPTIGLGQAGNKVHTNFIPFPLENFEGLKQSGRSLVLSLDPLTNVTILDKQRDFTLHAMPPKFLLEILVHFGPSRVNGVEGLVCLLHDELFQVIVRRNTDTALVPQDTFGVNGETRDFLIS